MRRATFFAIAGCLLYGSLSGARVQALDERRQPPPDAHRSPKAGVPQRSESSVGGASDWAKEAPSPVGWRSARWGMSVDEVVGAFPGDAKRKDVKTSNDDVTIRAKLQNKARFDGLDYEVEFGFDKAGRLNHLSFACKKVKDDSFDRVVASFTGLLGEPSGKGADAFALNGGAQWVKWEKDGVTIYVNYVQSRMNAFMNFRAVTVTARRAA